MNYIDPPDIQWEKVKTFYERSYFDPKDSRKRFRFHEKPSEAKIAELYLKMQTLKGELDYYYRDIPFLKNKLEVSRAPPELIEKRGPFE